MGLMNIELKLKIIIYKVCYQKYDIIFRYFKN